MVKNLLIGIMQDVVINSLSLVGLAGRLSLIFGANTMETMDIIDSMDSFR